MTEPPLPDPDQTPDERPQRRREYSGAASTLGVAALVVVLVGVAVWFFELRDGGSGGGDNDGFGIVDLPAAMNTTGQAPAAREGRAAPDFTLQDTGGSTVTLDSLRGKWVLLNFWASWCPPCRAEVPDLESLSRRTAGGDLTVLGVNQQEPQSVAKGFADEFGLTYPVVLDRDGEVSAAYQVAKGLPVSFLLDPQGVVRKVYIGQIPADTLATFEHNQLTTKALP